MQVREHFNSFSFICLSFLPIVSNMRKKRATKAHAAFIAGKTHERKVLKVKVLFQSSPLSEYVICIMYVGNLTLNLYWKGRWHRYFFKLGPTTTNAYHRDTEKATKNISTTRRRRNLCEITHQVSSSQRN